MNIFQWLEQQFNPEYVTSEQFIFNHMTSQSGETLPVIYQPFNSENPFHWADRGSIFDFLYSIDAFEKKILDFGPGDGWPSLMLAPYAQEIIGLDSSQKRVETCQKNAQKLQIKNAHFQTYEPNENFPFPTNTFDGITAASAIEQTPNPPKTLAEIYRVLKPGGRLRFSYESLEVYRGKEQDFWLTEFNQSLSRIILFSRKIAEEYVLQYGITLSLPLQELMKKIQPQTEKKLVFANFNQKLFLNLLPLIAKVDKCKTYHPQGKTFLKLLNEVGFRQAQMTYTGKSAASQLYKNLKPQKKLQSMEEIDNIIKPVIQIVIELEAPLTTESMISAIK